MHSISQIGVGLRACSQTLPSTNYTAITSWWGFLAFYSIQTLHSPQLLCHLTFTIKINPITIPACLDIFATVDTAAYKWLVSSDHDYKAYCNSNDKGQNCAQVSSRHNDKTLAEFADYTVCQPGGQPITMPMMTPPPESPDIGP
ncbi:uncharacterized protein UTRI_01062 [Ustilago trichophora]|uniref:Uncharacterized protein n=1 Tax=Ustilago trichophora TaxID=86804 RepID=A0A5C3DV72_9BASI|nr:uncharacterized protein UTRI_01062 [Ustilago trichophora]